MRPPRRSSHPIILSSFSTYAFPHLRRPLERLSITLCVALTGRLNGPVLPQSLSIALSTAEKNSNVSLAIDAAVSDKTTARSGDSRTTITAAKHEDWSVWYLLLRVSGSLNVNSSWGVSQFLTDQRRSYTNTLFNKPLQNVNIHCSTWYCFHLLFKISHKVYLWGKKYKSYNKLLIGRTLSALLATSISITASLFASKAQWPCFSFSKT